MTAIFFLFSNGSVLDLLLRVCNGEKSHKAKGREREDVLDEIKDGHAVPDGTQQAVAIWCEEDVALSVNCAADVGKLVENVELLERSYRRYLPDSWPSWPANMCTATWSFLASLMSALR